MHSKKFEMVKNNYDNGYWSIERVHAVVAKGLITASEYKEITGETYKP